MAALSRSPASLEGERFDLIVIGGGIYGAMLQLESIRHGLRPLLLERSDYGGLTSFNNLRILHGGLRYLQSAHLTRFFESVHERRWFLRRFPDLVEPLPCLMPLYRRSLRNRPIMRGALAVNDLLTWDRNSGLPSDSRLPNGHLLGVRDTIARFPLARRDGLTGSAVWYDASMPYCHRILIETLHWAAAGGAVQMNYMDARQLDVSKGRVVGVTAVDALSGSTHQYRAPVVINAAGPGAEALLKQFGLTSTGLFKPSWAWNLLFDREPLSDAAVAVQPPVSGGRVYFARSLSGRLFVGTGHAPSTDGAQDEPEDSAIPRMIDDLNLSVPGLELKPDQLIRTYLGQLPAKQRGSVELSDAATLVDHSRQSGPAGLFSVAGVKFTTARSTASNVIGTILRTVDRHSETPGPGLPPRPPATTFDLLEKTGERKADIREQMRRIIETESPVNLADLLLRRANLEAEWQRSDSLLDDACSAFGWDDGRASREKSRYRQIFPQTGGNSWHWR